MRTQDESDPRSAGCLLVLVVLAGLVMAACLPASPTPTPQPTMTATLTITPVPSRTQTPTTTPTATHTAMPTTTQTATPTATRTPQPTGTPTATPLTQPCVNYWTMCIPIGQSCGLNAEINHYGVCESGKVCCAVITPAPGTPTVTSTPTVTPTPGEPGPVLAGSAAPGYYSQYDWPCTYPLTPQGYCPNGTWADGSYKNGNSFRTYGGMDWPKAAASGIDVYQNVHDLGGIFWVRWDTFNTGWGQYNWDEIDNYVAYANQHITMDSANGQAPKGVQVRIFGAMSNRPSGQCTNVDGGCILDDLTPDWVKGQMREPVPWGGPMKVDAQGNPTGERITVDDGTYWVKKDCRYDDLAAARWGGNLWNYSIWRIPKYDRSEWRRAAEQMYRDVAAHYAGRDVSFILGLGGVDGEYGNYIQNAFAGCEGLRESFGQQYGRSDSDMILPDLPKAWRMGSATTPAYVSCTSNCDPAWIFNQGLGIFQARAVDDGPNYSRVGEIGALDWAIKFAQAGFPVSWENAYSIGDGPYLYQMLSVIQQSWPRFFSLVGGSWGGDQGVLAEFLPWFGRTLATTPKVYWRAYHTAWNKCLNSCVYYGWQKDVEVGLRMSSLLPEVDSATLTVTQQQDRRAGMLRRAEGTITFWPDSAWPGSVGKHTATMSVTYLDAGNATLMFGCSTGTIAWPLDDSGEFRTSEFTLADCDLGARGVTLTAADGGVSLHEVTVEVKP